MTALSQICSVFFPDRAVVSITPHGSGRINRTWLVEFTAGDPLRTVLQKINTQVFPEPEKIMANLSVLAGHLDGYFTSHPLHGHDPWQVVAPIYTHTGSDHYRDEQGGFWRMITCVEDACSWDRLQGDDKARGVGRALGIFHRATAGLDPALLYDTLPGFHVTPGYLSRYDQVVSRYNTAGMTEDEKRCVAFVEKHRRDAGVLEEAFVAGRIRQRVIHGDPKVSNIMFSARTGRAVSLVDLDTVKPGLLHYDLGDCFRSSCNPAGGSGEDPAGVKFDLDLFAEVLVGYLGEMGDSLGDVDYELIGPAVHLISFELGLRYFTDHLEGDVYFRTEAAGQNLQRALGQFLLTDDITANQAAIRDSIDRARFPSK